MGRVICDLSSSSSSSSSSTMMMRLISVVLVSSLLLLLGVVFVLSSLSDLGIDSGLMGYSSPINEEGNKTISSPHRKLLHNAMEEPNRMWGEKCSDADIVINQGPTAPLPSGIPTYTVEIMNVCVTGCDISGIHLRCGWFSSARLINPKIFKRVRYNDCLVNDGKPLVNGGTLSFQYANTFLYPLSVSSIACH